MGKVLNWEELKMAVSEAKAKGKRIVFTNGCFDIIHIGHVRYLNEAKRLGDILIVGINSDASVRRLKKGRPIITAEQRAEVVSNLGMVDYVTIFEEDTPYELIRYLMPDILVKGGDWKKEDIVGSDIVRETYSLPFVDGISTTEIIERIRRVMGNG
ncbi:MAG: D-glycero-beta-D-manno-heptose 1-phosphate adenylyltransferase [Thermodesulfovibrionales bacterium]